jgi:glyoxylase-like metal-dependent hydrolase (beta-lactamase superfamily II)
LAGTAARNPNEKTEMKIGSFKVSIIETGCYSLDGGSLFGVIPKPLWSTKCAYDEYNRVQNTMNAMLIETNDRKILVDCGVGTKDGEKFREIFAVDPEKNLLEKSLAAHGVKCDQITDMMLTHLHFDHCGGGTRLEGKEVVPTFPKAKYYVQRKQYEHALERNERDRASYIEKNYQPLLSAGVLEFTEGSFEFLPGIEIVLSEGHTPALQMIKVIGDEGIVWYPADLIPMAAHLPLPYIPALDLYPLTTLAEKKKFLPQAADENWIVVFEHDPQHFAHRLKRDEKGNVVLGEAVNF